MEALALSRYRQINQFPIYSPEMDEKLGCLDIADEAPASDSSSCTSVSPVKEGNPFSRSSNSLTLAHDLKPLQPHTDTQQIRGDTPDCIRQDSCTQTNDDRMNSHQAGTNYYTDFNGRQFRERERPENINIPFIFPDVPRRRHVWGSDRHGHLYNEGYDSDGDISRGRSRNLSSPDGLACGSYEGSSGFGAFKKGLRRAKSGDAPVFNINNNDNNDYFAPLLNVPHSAGPRPQVMHSRSQGSLRHVQSRQPPLFSQSISVDCTPVGQNQVHEHLCAQSTMFVNLQQAITEATEEWERLESDVEAKFRELNVGLSVENRTQKDCKLLEGEINQLRKEIQAMYDECDQSGVQVPGDPPALANKRLSDLYPSYPISPSGPHTPSQNIAQVYPSFPVPMTPSTPPIQLQPKQRPKSSSPYRSISDDPVGDSVPSQSPPPLPPRQPMIATIATRPANEQWRCPRCTFDNLLVANCEMCQTPRPCVLRNNTPR